MRSARFGLIDKFPDGCLQGSLSEESDVAVVPQPEFVELRDFAQGVIPAAMAVAGHVAQQGQTPQDTHVCPGLQGAKKSVEFNDRSTAEQAAQRCFGGFRIEHATSVIVPSILSAL